MLSLYGPHVMNIIIFKIHLKISVQWHVADMQWTLAENLQSAITVRHWWHGGKQH